MLERRCDFCAIRMLGQRQHFKLSSCQLMVQPHTATRNPRSLDLCELCLVKELYKLVDKLEGELAKGGNKP
jgi:hypothetical protein